MAQKKKFITVEVPIMGESIDVLGTVEDLKNRTIKLDLSRKLKGKGLEITVKIMENEGQLFGIPKRLELMRFYLLRTMRKRAIYVEDSFETACKDVTVKIKPFLITRKKVSRAVRGNLRKTAREFLSNYVKDLTFIELAEQTISGDIQKEMLPKLKKVYPLSFSDLRILETKELDKAELKFEKTSEAEEDEKEIEIQEEEKVDEEPKKEEKEEKKTTKKKSTKKEEKKDE